MYFGLVMRNTMVTPRIMSSLNSSCKRTRQVERGLAAEGNPLLGTYANGLGSASVDYLKRLFQVINRYDYCPPLRLSSND